MIRHADSKDEGKVEQPCVYDALYIRYNASLLKQCRTYCEACFPEDPLQAIFCRLAHLRSAVESAPTDGEAFQYLGLALMQYEGWLMSKTGDAPKRTDVLGTAVDCLEQAQALTGIDLEPTRRPSYLQISAVSWDPGSKQQAYTKAIKLLQESSKAGCNVQEERDTVSLNHGLFVSNLDRFQDACSILERVASRKVPDQDRGRVIDDAYRLWRFCESRYKR
jgi:tetratricopeptide (TPR) repeat protein